MLRSMVGTTAKAIEFDLMKIGLASPDQIMAWSCGEVEKPETINYRTFKPERKGLFCEKIFGPVKDWECHCGKYRRVRYRGIVCERCGVEVTTSRVRRERMGHIKLAVPVVHVWFLRGAPGYVALLLNMSTKALEEVVYYDAYLVVDVAESLKDELKVGQVLREAEYLEYREKYGAKFHAEMGGGAVKFLLEKLDLPATVKKLRKDFRSSSGQKRMKTIKRLRVAEALLKSGNRPEWMILDVLPVMPPDLRPMVQLEGGRFATSDLNDLYRRVLNRNNRLRKMINMGAPEIIVRNEKRMLQEAVDVLIDNGRRTRSVTGSSGRPLKSLSDIVEGKQGRFRQNLLGKRADYSGRSVIVVGPHLKLNQCGLPKEMALELFKPFVIRRLVERGHAHNVKSAKRQIERHEVMVWDVLEEVIEGHLVLLNRAPTLHRLGIQAFEPVLVEGKAIQIHPLVCTAFNADFDGDQMAVHVPLLAEAQMEAKILMQASTNVLSPASGRPVITPTQDMVLGTYFLTVHDPKRTKGEGRMFASDEEAMLARDLGVVDLQAKVKVLRDGALVETTIGRIEFNHSLNRLVKGMTGETLPFFNDVANKKKIEAIVKQSYERFGTAVAAEVADEIKRIGYKYATLGGISISIEDLQVPEAKRKIIAKASREAETIENRFRSGHLTDNEKFVRTLDIWSDATEAVTQAMLDAFDPLNSVYLMAFSGARGNVQQVRQLAGMRGLMADSLGHIIEIPILSNFKEGLNVTEFFISSYGARKGLVDTALRTADSGYLTRRLVDVAQDVMITVHDCETKKGITLSSLYEGYDEIISLKERLVGRYTVEIVRDPNTGKKIVGRDEEITAAIADAIMAAQVPAVKVRSVLSCQAERGICQLCFGVDLSTGRLIDVGEAIGIIAAQSIGEPGTQLTMRTFHIGGVATHKGSKVVVKSRHEGKVSLEKEMEIKPILNEQGEKVYLVTRAGILWLKTRDKKYEYALQVGSILLVKDGETVGIDDILAEYDPNYGYVIVNRAGQAKFFHLEITERKTRSEQTKRDLYEKVVKKDGEVFIYNPELSKTYQVSESANLFVRPGERVTAGQEISAGVTSDISGIVLRVDREGKRPTVIVGQGEVYSLPAGARILIDEGDKVSAYDVIAKLESRGREGGKTRDIIQGLPRVEELFEARTPRDVALLSEADGRVEVREEAGFKKIVIHAEKDRLYEYSVPFEVRLKVMSGDRVKKGVALTEGTINPHDVLRILGVHSAQAHLVEEVQRIYRSQGVTINDKHIETIIRQMTKKVRVLSGGETTLLPGELVESSEFEKLKEKEEGKGEEPLLSEPVLLGITKASLKTESFISAASFQETARILTEAAIMGKEDHMYGLKENVIIGKAIPAGTGFHSYRNLELLHERPEGASEETDFQEGTFEDEEEVEDVLAASER